MPLVKQILFKTMKTNLKLKQLEAKLEALQAAKDANISPKVKSSIESQKVTTDAGFEVFEYKYYWSDNEFESTNSMESHKIDINSLKAGIEFFDRNRFKYNGLYLSNDPISIPVNKGKKKIRNV